MIKETSVEEYKVLSEEDLQIMLLNNQGNIWELFLDDMIPRVNAYVLSQMGPRGVQEMDDIAQKAMEVLLTGLRRGPHSVRAFLIGVVKNLIKKKFAANAKARTTLDKDPSDDRNSVGTQVADSNSQRDLLESAKSKVGSFIRDQRLAMTADDSSRNFSCQLLGMCEIMFRDSHKPAKMFTAAFGVSDSKATRIKAVVANYFEDLASASTPLDIDFIDELCMAWVDLLGACPVTLPLPVEVVDACHKDYTNLIVLHKKLGCELCADEIEETPELASVYKEAIRESISPR